MTTDTAIAHKDDLTKSVLALLFSISPIYFLVQARSKLGLDNLHVGLVQIVLLLIMRWFLGIDPRGLRTPSSSATSSAASSEVADSDTPVKANGHAIAEKGHKAGRKRRSGASSSPYPPKLLDETVYQFLNITEPDYSALLPNKPLPNEVKLPTAALSTWKTLHEAENLKVLQHPKVSTLYAIQATFPDVPLRKLFEVLTNIELRKEWDGMASGAQSLDEIHVGGRRGALGWLGMKGVAVIKAKDLCLLSVAARLPPKPDKASESDEKLKEGTTLRLICATTSFKTPKCPPKSDYNRMELAVSGFIAEEDGHGGSRVTQITDLSGLGSWVPSAVVRTVTQTMIPKSLMKLGRSAAEYDIAKQSKYPVDSDEWLPPLLGTDDDVEEDTDDLTDDEDSSSEELAPGQSRDLHALVGQLRSLTSRLTALEEGTTTAKSKWYNIFTLGGVEQDQMTMGARAGLVGGALGAATAVALVSMWAKRRRG